MINQSYYLQNKRSNYRLAQLKSSTVGSNAIAEEKMASPPKSLGKGEAILKTMATTASNFGVEDYEKASKRPGVRP